MAAAAINWSNYLAHLGFGDDVRNEITVAQGFDSVDVFANATKRDIEDLVSNVRKTAVTPATDPPTMYAISTVQQGLLWKIAMYCKFLKMTNTSHTQARGSRANLQKVLEYFMNLSNHKNAYKQGYSRLSEGVRQQEFIWNA